MVEQYQNKLKVVDHNKAEREKFLAAYIFSMRKQEKRWFID